MEIKIDINDLKCAVNWLSYLVEVSNTSKADDKNIHRIIDKLQLKIELTEMEEEK